jgi:LPS-assembly protein
VKRTGLFLLIFVLLSGCFFKVTFSAASQEGPVNIEAETIFYDSEKETYRARGNVIILFTGGYLKADEVTLVRSTGDAVAEGNVVIKSGEDILEGDGVKFNINDKTGVLNDGTLFFRKNNLYLRGKEIRKKGDTIYSLKDARATTCDGEIPDWRLTGREVDVNVDGYGRIKHGTFQVRNFPVLYVPYLIFPAKKSRQTGFLLPYFSYSKDKLGWDVEVPFFWAISENADATFYQRYMDKRGFQEGAEFRYQIGENSFGTLYGSYLYDTMKISEENADRPNRDWRDGEQRWSYYLNHETEFTPGFYLRTDINKVSDNWYFRDFDSYNYFLQHYGSGENQKFKKVSFVGDRSLNSLDSKARLVKNWDLFNLTALVRYTDNFMSDSNDETLQKYPGITLFGVKQPFFDSPLYFELESSYDYYYRERGYRGHLVDLFPTLSLPLSIGKCLRFEPEVGFRETRWDATYKKGIGEGRHNDRAIYNVGATLSTEIERIFPVRGKRLEKVRHGIKPEITYTYIPNVLQDEIPDFVEKIEETNTLNYSFTNTFTGKLRDDDGNVSYRQFLRLKLGQDFNIKEARRENKNTGNRKRPFGDIIMELDINPFSYCSFDSDVRYDVNAGEWEELNSRIDISDERGDSLTSEYRYTRDTVEEVNFSARAKIIKALDLFYSIRRNELYKKSFETMYGIDYHRQCWSAELSYTESDDDRSIMLIFSLYGFGKAATSQNW